MANAPNFTHYITFLAPLSKPRSIAAAVATTVAPAFAAILFVCIAIGIVHCELYLLFLLNRKANGHSGCQDSAQLSGSVSNSETRLTAFRATFVVLIVAAGVWMIGLGAILFSLQALDTGSGATTSVAEGAIYTAAFILVLGLNLAFIAPGLLLLQPVRLWKLGMAQWRALTPRQHFRGKHVLRLRRTGNHNLLI